MDNIKTYIEYIELNEARTKEIARRFNAELQPLYDKLSDQVSEEDLTIIKGRIFMHRKYLNKYGGVLKKKLLNNPYHEYVNYILDQLDELRKEDNKKVGNSNKLDKEAFDVLISRFPKRLQNIIRNIANKDY